MRRKRYLQTPDGYNGTYTEKWLELQRGRCEHSLLSKGSYFCSVGDTITIGENKVLLKLTGHRILTDVSCEAFAEHVHRPVCKIDAAEFLSDGSSFQRSHGLCVDLIANSVGRSVHDSLKLVLDLRSRVDAEG